MKKVILLSLCCAMALLGCKKEEDQAKIDREKIEQYLKDNNLNATAHSSGLYYIIAEPGTGGNPPAGATVTVRYKGYLLDGTVFDQTTGSQVKAFPLQSLIPGWQIGIPLLKKGGKGTFFLPSALGYGSRDSGNIPGNSVLIFEIELVDYR